MTCNARCRRPNQPKYIINPYLIYLICVCLFVLHSYPIKQWINRIFCTKVLVKDYVFGFLQVGFWSKTLQVGFWSRPLQDFGQDLYNRAMIKNLQVVFQSRTLQAFVQGQYRGLVKNSIGFWSRTIYGFSQELYRVLADFIYIRLRLITISPVGKISGEHSKTMRTRKEETNGLGGGRYGHLQKCICSSKAKTVCKCHI